MEPGEAAGGDGLDLDVGCLWCGRAITPGRGNVSLRRGFPVAFRLWLDLRLVPVFVLRRENAFLDALFVLFSGQGNRHWGLALPNRVRLGFLDWLRQVLDRLHPLWNAERGPITAGFHYLCSCGSTEDSLHWW